MTLLKIGVVVLALAASVLAAAGCAGVGEEQETDCVVFDASKSTRFIVPQYEEYLEAEVAEDADGGGTVAAVVVTGDPKVEAVPTSEDFSALTGSEKAGERGRKVHGFVTDLEAEVRASALGEDNPSGGSGIVAGVALLARYTKCDSMLVLSDGIETDAFASKTAGVAKHSSRVRIVRRLEAEGLVAKLDGAPLRFPFGGVLPQGTAIPDPTLAGLRAFWGEYAKAAGTDLSWRRNEG